MVSSAQFTLQGSKLLQDGSTQIPATTLAISSQSASRTGSQRRESATGVLSYLILCPEGWLHISPQHSSQTSSWGGICAAVIAGAFKAFAKDDKVEKPVAAQLPPVFGLVRPPQNPHAGRAPPRGVLAALRHGRPAHGLRRHLHARDRPRGAYHKTVACLPGQTPPEDLIRRQKATIAVVYSS